MDWSVREGYAWAEDKVMPTGLGMSLSVSSRCSILMEVPALTVVTIDSPLEYGRSTARSTAGC